MTAEILERAAPAGPGAETRDVVTVETHGSVVLMVGDRAYKLMKPLDLGFMDNRTREGRERACHREVEVNRRFAPDVYLGVLDLVDEHGEAVDHLVAMRRLPPGRRLGAQLDGPDARRLVVDVARAVARVHAEADRSPEIDAAGAPAAVRRLWADGVRELRAHAGRVLHPSSIDDLEALALAYLEGRKELLERRIASGWIRDGHGDLLADDVYCLPEGPRLLDCLAFDDRLRHGDVLLDAAFLAMDLEARGHPGLAAVFLREWSATLGEEHPRSLEHHYLASRAHVRSTVTCIRAEQGDHQALAAARRLHALAMRHLEAGSMRLVLVGGGPGTGKSTVAAALRRGCDWRLERSDAVRRELAGLPPAPVRAAGFREGAYAPEMTDRVYAELLARADRALGLGEPVVLDATWADPAHREAARRLARRRGADLVEIECRAPLQVAMERVRSRLARDEGDSDATPELARMLADRRPQVSTARLLDTDRPLEEVVRDAMRAVGAC